MFFLPGCYYYNARWYDPNLGRFTTEDPIRSGLNWYIYANNNPLTRVDPTGLDDININLNLDQEKATMLYVPRTPSGGINESGIVKETYRITNNVRTQRQDPVEFRGYYYYPETFPTGEWNITETNESPKGQIGPYIRTDANRDVMTYEKKDGEWVESGEVNDSGFLLHGGDAKGNITGDNDVDSRTFGCGRGSNDDIREMSAYAKKALDSGGEATVSVPDVKHDSRGEVSGL